MIFVSTRKEREQDCPRCGARGNIQEACTVDEKRQHEVMFYHQERSAAVRGVLPHWEAL